MVDERRLWARKGPTLVWQQETSDGPVFDPATGETHFLNELPALILSVIDDNPRPYSAVLERLAGPVDLDDQARAQVVTALLSLEAVELVESRPAKTE